MKATLKRLIALILAMAMSLSLLSANVWAAELEPQEDSSAPVESSVVEEPVEEEPTEDSSASTEPIEEEEPEEAEPEESELAEKPEENAPEQTEEEPKEEPDKQMDAEPETTSEAQPETEIKTQSDETSGKCGENVTWSFDESTGTLIISGTGKMEDYCVNNSEKTPWFDNRNSVKKAIIEQGVTSIGDEALWACSSLTSISIPDSVTSIGDYAFSNCSSLTSISIPDSVTSIGDDAFKGCSNLTGIDVRAGNKAFVSINGVVFNKNQTCLRFYPAGKRGSYSIPDGVTSIGGDAFKGCSSLTSVNIPDSVTYIGWGAFTNCSSLTSVTIPDSVTSIGYHAFTNCSNLTSISIPDSVTSIGEEVFRGCSSLTSVNIPDSVTYIGEGAFKGCSSLTSVTIPDNVTTIKGDAFSGCSSLISITIPDRVTTISSNAFYGCSSLISITIPDRVTTISSNAFYGCSSLKSISIPDSVTSIGEEVFRGCSSLTSITIPDRVTWIGYGVFHDCSRLTSVIIPDGVTSIMSSVFRGCSSLTSVTIGNGVESIKGGAFCGCSSLTSVEIPDSVTSIGEEVFRGCSSLTSIDIPDSVTSIGKYSFDGCRNLMSITIPAGVTNIGFRAFYGCTGLSSIFFSGSAPQCDSNCFAWSNAIAYYPKDDDSWTEEVRNKIGQGANLTWKEWDPSTAGESARLKFDEKHYYCTEGQSVSITAVYKSESEPKNYLWHIPGDQLSFSGTSVQGPSVTGEENTWWISNYVTCKKSGSYTITLDVNGTSYQIGITVREKEDDIQPVGYGLEPGKGTSSDSIKTGYRELYQAIDSYMAVINSGVKAETNTTGSVNALNEKDQANEKKVLTLDPNIKEDKVAQMAVYAGLEEFYKRFKGMNPSLGKIDLNKSIDEIVLDITNKISASKRSYNFSTRYQGYIVQVNILSQFKAFTGTITVTKPNGKKYYNYANDGEAAKEMMALYYKELQKTEETVLKDGLSSYMKEWNKVTGLTDFTRDTFIDVFSKIYDFAKEKGYGKLEKYAVYLYDGYKVSKDIASVKNTKSLEGKLSNADALLKQVQSMKYSDRSIKDKAVKAALEQVEKKRKELEDKLYNYVYHPELDSDTSWSGFSKAMDKIGRGFKKIRGQCPVRMVVRAKNGTILGYAEDNHCEYDDSIYIEVQGDVKTIYIPSDMEIDLEMTGTRSGTMTYTVEEFADGQTVGRMIYYNVPLEKNKVYTQSVSSGGLDTNANANPLKSDDGTQLAADEYIAADQNAVCTISCESTEGGCVSGARSYARGDLVELWAVSQDGYYFDGWYSGSEIIELDPYYHFPAEGDVELKACFKKSRKPQFITCPERIDKKIGDPDFSIDAVTSGDGELQFFCEENEVIDVSDDGKITVKKAGTAEVLVIAQETETFNAAEKTIEINVNGIPHQHTYGLPNWIWEENEKSAQASFTCTDNDDTQTVNATITHSSTPGTCKDKEKTTYTAKVDFDGQEYTDSKVVEGALDATNHTGGKETRNRKAATCGVVGYTGDTYCKGCGEKLSSGQVIPATGNHTWDSGTVTTQPTTSTEGVKTYKCTVCGQTRTESVAKLTQPTSIKMNDCEVILSETVLTYDGSWKTPDVTVRYNGEVVGSQCYNLSYQNNVQVGTASVIVKGRAPYEGSKTVTFRIIAPANVNYITGKDFIFRTYNKKKDQSFNLGAKANGAPLSYKSSNKKVTVKNGKVTVKKGFMGKATITVTAAETESYLSAQKKITLMVGPSATQLSSAKFDAKKKVLNAAWKKNTTGKGYEIQVSLKKDFKKVAKKVKINKNDTVKTAIKGMKKGTYYVRIRTINGKTCSDWSKAKTVKVK